MESLAKVGGIKNKVVLLGDYVLEKSRGLVGVTPDFYFILLLISTLVLADSCRVMVPSTPNTKLNCSPFAVAFARRGIPNRRSRSGSGDLQPRHTPPSRRLSILMLHGAK
jgi:hypothetical protein